MPNQNKSNHNTPQQSQSNQTNITKNPNNQTTKQNIQILKTHKHYQTIQNKVNKTLPNKHQQGNKHSHPNNKHNVIPTPNIQLTAYRKIETPKQPLNHKTN